MIKKVCLTCGNDFGVPKHREHSAKFCSRECKHAFGRTNKECLFCGKPFASPKRLKRQYCSRKCADEVKKKRIVKTCKICGKKNLTFDEVDMEMGTGKIKCKKHFHNNESQSI